MSAFSAESSPPEIATPAPVGAGAAGVIDPGAIDTRAFELLPVPVAWADACGLWLGANAAFVAATGLVPGDARGRPLVDLLGLHDGAAALADRLQAGDDLEPLPVRLRTAAGRALAGRLGQRRQGAMRVLTLQLDLFSIGDVGDPDPAGQLALAKSLGGFGIWTHDLRTGERHWDAQIWQFLGLAPQPGALPLAQAMTVVHVDDRQEVSRRYRRSLGVQGGYSHRWRMVGADGQARHVRSLWQVLAGADGRPAQVMGMMFDDTETVTLARHADEAQARLNLAITLADIAVWRHDIDTARIHTSDLGWALVGLPPQPDGLALSQIAMQLHPDDLLALQAQVQDDPALRQCATDALDQAPIDLGLRCRQSDGSWRYLLTRRVRQRDEQGRLIGHVGVALDLSDRFDQQQRALALAQRLEMATAAAGVGVWSARLSTPPVTHWDEQMRALHGLGASDPPPDLATYLAQHVHEADRAMATENLGLLMQRDEGLLDMDMRVVGGDGQVRRLATRSSISGSAGQRHLHGVMLDVTERYATGERLRQATERAALAARGAGIGTWESAPDAGTGWWDEQMFKLRGLDRRPARVTTDDMLAWLHPLDREAFSRQLRAALQDDAPTNTEFRVVWPDGTVRWLASRSAPVRDEAGQTVRRIGINWDITDARNAAATRQERLLAQRESQAKSRFLARISHELRTPLNAVLGFSQLLLAETPSGTAPDPETWRRRVEHVQASGEHLLALIDDVLELSSLESGELPLSLQPVALAPLVHTSLPLVELLAQAHGVSLALGTLDGWALADPARLQQVLLNLLSNAIKYNRPGGRVTVSAEPSGPWLLLRVEDTGRGLTEEQLQHLFEPFNRLGLEREGIAGTGIGLAIVQASVQHMGGTVQVSSRPGVGSAFELSLQRSAAPGLTPAGFAEGAALPPLPLPRGKRLLYIEDNELNLLIVSELIKQRPDLTLFSAPDGASGLALARDEQPVLILLDMQLPDMDGHEVLHRLRVDPATSAIRCIALSANAMPEDIRRARESGVDDYWTKPLDLSAFLRSLDALFGPAPAA
jgi:signal transduction histidine kinase